MFVNVFLYHFEKGKSADNYAAFESFSYWATSGIHKPLSCVKQPKHLHPNVQASICIIL